MDCNRPIGQNQLSEKRIRNRITNRPGSKCNLKCPKTTILVGTYSITCESDGQWVGDSNGTCHSTLFIYKVIFVFLNFTFKEIPEQD